MEPMKLDIQMFAPDAGTVDIDVNFKDISEDELPESFVIALDAEEVTIPISGLSTNYVWNHSGTYVFDIISVVTDGYSIIAYQLGNGFIDIDVYKNSAFTRKIIDDNTIQSTSPGSFANQEISNPGVFSARDKDGNSAYYRGLVTNNYVKMANYWWRIIRVNGNGDVRIMYDGIAPHANGEVTYDKGIGTSYYQSTSYDNAYVGYMYGTPGSDTYDDTHANLHDSLAKKNLDSWYENHLMGYEKYISDNSYFYCDRRVRTGTGISSSYTYYSFTGRTTSPSLSTPVEHDLFTLKSSNFGNQTLDYPIGLINADELVMSGISWGWTKSGDNPYGDSDYWTITPFLVDIGDSLGAYVYTGFLSMGATGNDKKLLRPVINLKRDLKVKGEGTIDNPYTISSDDILPFFNNVKLSEIKYNGVDLTEVYFNKNLVFGKGDSIYTPDLRTLQVGDALWEGTSLKFDIPVDTYISKYSQTSPPGSIITGTDIKIEANADPQMIAFLCDKGNTVAQSQIFYPDLDINIGEIPDLDFRSPETPSYKVQDTITSINSTHKVYPYIRVDTATLYRDGVVLVRYYDLDDNYIFKDFDTWADFYSWCYANKNNIHAIEIYTYGTTDTIFFNDLFSGSTSIISVDLQHMRDISGTVSCAHAFENCPNLEFFRCGEFEIQSAAYMFYNDTALNDCMLGYCKGIHNLEQTWAHCSSLTEISLLNETTGETVSFTNVGSMEDAFYNSGLASFDFHHWTNPTLNTLGTTFSNTSSSLVVDFYNLNIEDVAMQGVNQINGSGTAKFFAPVSFDYTVIDFLFSDWRVSYYDKHGYTTGPTGEPAA